MGMATRRFFKSTIVELEQIFESSKDDHAVLKGLLAELEHRDTNRAKALAKKVNEQLKVMRLTNPANKLTTQNASTPSKESTEVSSAEPTTNKAFSKSEYSDFVEYCHSCRVFFLDEITPVIFVAFKSKNKLTSDAIRHLKNTVSDYQNGKVEIVEEEEFPITSISPVRVPWDEDETILLVDLYCHTKDMEKLKAENYATAFVEMLKVRAVSLGMMVDDKYRNLAGIKMKLQNIRYLMTNGELGLSGCSKLEKRIVDLYQTDQELFALKLKQAQNKWGSFLYCDETRETSHSCSEAESGIKTDDPFVICATESIATPSLDSYTPTTATERGNESDVSDCYLPVNLSLDDPIEVLNLSVRSKNALKHAGITDVRMMLGTDEQKLYLIKNLGAKSITEVLGYQETIKQCLSLGDVDTWSSENESNTQVVTAVMRGLLDEYILRGIYNQETIEALSEEDAKLFSDVCSAREVLGEKLALEAYSCPDKAKQLQRAFSDYVIKHERIEKLRNAFELIPKFRLDNALHEYLLSFCSTKIRNILSNLEEVFLSLNTVGEIPIIFDSIAATNESTDSFLQILKALSADIRPLVQGVINSVYNESKNVRMIYALKQRSNGMTLQKIADEMGLTRERVRQLEVKGKNTLLKRLRVMDIDIFMFISAERNGGHILTTAEVRRYFGDMENIDIFLYVAQSECIRAAFRFNENLDAFCYKDATENLDSIREVVKMLPCMIEQEKRDDILSDSSVSTGLPFEALRIEFVNAYKLSGNIYHKGRLTLTQGYDYVLNHYYPAGIKLYNNDELIRFRKKVADVFGDIELPANNRAIDARLADISVLCGRGTYIHPSHVIIEESLIDEVRSYINDSARAVFSFNELYERFKDKLFLKSNVSNRYFFQGVLKYYLGDQYYFAKDTISKEEGADLVGEIENFIREKGEVHKSEVFAEYTGITEIMLSMKASVNRNIISMDNGWYMHASQLSIEPNDYRIREIIKQQTKILPVSIRKLLEILWLSFPEFLTRNNITNHGKLFGVLRYMFGEEFAFSRPYIAKLGTEELTNIVVIKQHLKLYYSIAISDLMDLCNDHQLRFLSIRTLIRNLNDEFLRTDTETLTRSNIELDEDAVAEIANLIMERLDAKGYFLASKIDNYIFYPDIGFEWNAFLLRSIVEKYMNDSIGIIDIPMIDTYVMNSIFVDPALDIESYESLLRSILKTEHNNDPFWAISDAINWLQQEGLFLRDPPKCLLDGSIIFVDEYGKLIVE